MITGGGTRVTVCDRDLSSENGTGSKLSLTLLKRKDTVAGEQDRAWGAQGLVAAQLVNVKGDHRARAVGAGSSE
jgi:hypothetical protein